VGISSAEASEQWYLELREPGVDESMARRSIALEIGEVEVPGDPRRANESREDVSLFVRVERSEEKLYVSLWDRGEFVGRRRISDSGSARLRARRVGLAAAELARQLRVRRLRLAREKKLEETKSEATASAASGADSARSLGLRSGVESVLLSEGAWSLGPSLGLEFDSHLPVRFTTRLGWLTGSVPALREATSGGTAPHFSHLDLSLAGVYVMNFASASQFNVGTTLTASALHFGGATSVDAIASARDTWTARGGLRLGVGHQLNDQVRTDLDLSLGAILRRIPIMRGEKELRLGGAFVGVMWSATLTP